MKNLFEMEASRRASDALFDSYFTPERIAENNRIAELLAKFEEENSHDD